MPKGTGVFSPFGELRAANIVTLEDPGGNSVTGSSAQRRFQHIPGDARTFDGRGGKRVHLQKSSEVEAALRPESEAQVRTRRRGGSDDRPPGAPLFWKGERLEAAPGGHEIVDRMHHQRIGADVCQYNLDSAVQQVRSSGLRGCEATGGPASNVEKLKAGYDRRLVERQRVWRDYGQDLAVQVSRNAVRREDAWLAWLEQQQQATNAHNAGVPPTNIATGEDEDPEDEDELHRMMRLGHWDPQYRASAGFLAGQPGDGREQQTVPMKWPQSFDPTGVGPVSSNPEDYAVDLEPGWNDGFAALSDSISDVESILGEIWNEVTVAEEASRGQHELGLPPPAQAPKRAEEREQESGSATLQTMPTDARGAQQQPQLEHSDPPRGRWAVASERRAVRDAILQRDRGGTHVAIGEGAVTPGGQREALEDRLMSNQHQMERATNAALGDPDTDIATSRGDSANRRRLRSGAGAVPELRSGREDGLGFLMPPPEELCAEPTDVASTTQAKQRQRREEASLYRLKARGRMFESPSNAQRTFHEGAHVATSMGIAGAGIMACFEKDKLVHERDLPQARPSKSDIIAADIASSNATDRPPRRLPERNRDNHSAPSAPDTNAGELLDAAGRVQQVRQARDAKRLEIHVQQHESMLKEERRQGTEVARKNRYVDSPLVTGKPKIDRETGRIPLIFPMAQRTASLGSDPVGAPRYTGLGDGIALAAQPEALIQPQPASTPKRSAKARMRNTADRAASLASTNAEVPPDV